jgi:two-component system NtrC family sensor kinase
MEAFVWDQRFVTGIESVDKQHQHLVDIVNRVGDMLLGSANKTEADVQAIFKELAEYAHHHFSDEEKMMNEFKLDAQHSDAHKRRHGDFVTQLVSMWRSRASMSNPAEILHGFLTAWLSFHILGEDKAMARQIERIRKGESADAAFAAEQTPVDSSTAALLGALQKLYQVLSMQNQDLAQVNIRLEEKVAERTRELGNANVQLQSEQAELKLLLQKVEQAQSQLLQSEKMASIGQLAAGVAHEINNPVGFVNSNLGTLKTYVGRLVALLDTCKTGKATEADFKTADFEYLRTDIDDLVRESQDGLDRVKKIVSNLKDFSHVDEAEWQEADLNAGLESTLNVVWNEIKYKAEVVKQFGTLPAVQCIPAQINQVFMNLLVNAAQAIEQKGVITLRSAVDGDSVWLEVADTGKGMSPEVQKRIFEPFYTTKPVGKGTGLGLSLSYDIVHKHGGRISVVSKPGEGSTFRVRLPIRGNADAEKAA